MAWAEQLPSKRWRGGYRDPDGRKQYVTQPGGAGFDRKTDAREAAEDAAAKARRRAAVQKGTQSAKIRWGDWWDLLAEKRRKRISDNDVNEHFIVEKYIRPAWGNMPLNEIKNRAIKDWVDDELIPGKAPSYVRRIYAVFRVSMSLAVDKEILDATPCVGIKLPTVRRRPKAYMDENYLPSLGEYLDGQYQDLVAFGRETGLRPGELCGLHASRLDLRVGWLEVAEVFVARRKTIRAYPKDEDARSVPLTAKAIEIAKRQLADRDLRAGCGIPHADGTRCRSALVFLSVTGIPINPRTYNEVMRRAADRAGQPLRSPYTARRGFATRAAEGGTDPFTIAAYMGHADIEETNGYVQRTEAARRRFVAGMGEAAPLTVVGQDDVRGAAQGADPSGDTVEDTGSSNVKNSG